MTKELESSNVDDVKVALLAIVLSVLGLLWLFGGSSLLSQLVRWLTWPYVS